jgi:hypothetical protein
MPSPSRLSRNDQQGLKIADEDQFFGEFSRRSTSAHLTLVRRASEPVRWPRLVAECRSDKLDEENTDESAH